MQQVSMENVNNEILMEIPKGYKKVGTSIIPEDWELKKFGDFVRKVKRKNNDNLPLEPCSVSKQYGVIYQNEKFTKRIASIDTSNYYILKKGEFVYDPMSAYYGAVGRQKYDEDVIVSPAYEVFEVEGISKDFFEQVFTSDRVKSLYSYLSYGGNEYWKRMKLSWDSFCEIKFPVPPLHEQEYIAKNLQTQEEHIKLKMQVLEQKEAQKKGLMQKLLWGHIRCNDIENGCSNQEINKRNSLIRRGVLPEGYKKVKRFVIPTDWEFIKISEIAKQVSRVNKNNNKYVVLSCTKHDGLVDSLTYFGRQVFSSDLSKYKVVSKNEFAYATNHIEEGSIGLQRDIDYGLVSPMYTVFKTNSKINREFLFALLKTENYIRIYETMMSASVDRRGSLRWNEFSKIQIPLPSLKEQEKIMSILLTANKEIKLLEEELENLRLRKKGLMQLLLTGKVRN